MRINYRSEKHPRTIAHGCVIACGDEDQFWTKLGSNGQEDVMEDGQVVRVLASKVIERKVYIISSSFTLANKV